MENKQCTSCKGVKPLNNFLTKSDRKNGSSMCKQCFSKYCIKRWQDFKVDAINKFNNKCGDCDVSYPDYPASVFEFHHLDPSQKEMSWGKMRIISKIKREKELNKCVMLCANCHRIRHS